MNTGYYLSMAYFVSFMWCLLRVEDLNAKGVNKHFMRRVGLWCMIPVVNTVIVLADIVYSAFRGGFTK